MVILISDGTCSTDDVQDLPDIAIRAPVAGDGHHIISDDGLTDDKWYRSVYNGWQYLMVDSTIKPNFSDCGTYYPIYLRGKYRFVYLAVSSMLAINTFLAILIIHFIYSPLGQVYFETNPIFYICMFYICIAPFLLHCIFYEYRYLSIVTVVVSPVKMDAAFFTF